MQGGVHALAIALRLGLIKNKNFVLKTIDAAIRAIGQLCSNKGSLVEAYPGEHSWCVTALVAFDTLCAIIYLEKYLERDQKDEYLSFIEPLIRFISRYYEQHAVISNHLATGAAAITFWKKISGEASSVDEELLNIIYSNQSEEGWFKEYEGADPGYQTLCTHYLYAIYSHTKDKYLLTSLKQSGAFLKYFVHPDGTIGGLYGSRNTEVYYPAGIIGLASFSEDFALMARLLENGIKEGHHILPQSIDVGNFVPLLNTFAVAAWYYDKAFKILTDIQQESKYKEEFSKKFNDAGILIRSNSSYYAIINYKKGGTLKVYDQRSGNIDFEDGGLFGRLRDGRCFSTQQFDHQALFDDFIVYSGFYSVKEKFPTPASHIILRLLFLTFFRSVAFGNYFKKIIVKLLITGKNRIDGEAMRRFEFKEDKVIVHETIRKPKGCILVCHPGKYKAIHMASSGYHLAQSEQQPIDSKRVEIKSVEQTL